MASAGPLVGFVDGSFAGPFEGVVKELVVRTGACEPFGFESPFDGAAEIWVCPVCMTGLPQGSASGNSRDLFRISCGCAGGIVVAGWSFGGEGGDVGSWAGFAANSFVLGIEVVKLGSFGSGRSGRVILDVCPAR